MIDRRQFLGMVGIGASHRFSLAKLASAFQFLSPKVAIEPQSKELKAYGSGYFGEWITDQFGLPAYKYTCNQVADGKAVSPVHKEWRAPTDQTHQVGNDRLVAAVSNYGYVQVRQDEGSPKFLNDYCPEQGRYGAGIGFLTDGNAVLSTYYPGNGTSFDRVMGEGYLRKTVKGDQCEVDQTIFAPFGDDPVLISMVTVTNHSSRVRNLRWTEYWGCQNYQFSFRSGMEAGRLKDPTKAAALRRDFAGRFAHRFDVATNGAGLVESQKFLGRTPEDEELWKQVEAEMKNPSSDISGRLPDPSTGATMEDLNPPSTFLVSLDAAMSGFSTDAAGFFGSGGIGHPDGLASNPTNNLSSTGGSSAFLLERDFELRPGESRTLYFLYGYLPSGFKIDDLVKKYSVDPAGLLARSSASWKTEGLRFSVPSEPWVEREISWHNYYLRSALTYDSFFGEHILSQGHVYQYIMGFQGAARDPLQHIMPFIFSNAEFVKEIVRYTLKEIQPDGSIPYGIVGSGVPMPSPFVPGDLEMWLLWTASEYVLATRDEKFLDERIPAYSRLEARPTDPTVGELLGRSYAHLVNVIGVGKHGLMRLAMGDWNDGVVVVRVPEKLVGEVREQGESVLDAAMASYVLDYYARMLTYAGDKATAGEALLKAEGQRQAVQANWSGRWFRRAWLGPNLGWIGDDRLWLEPQPWAIIGGAATPGQRETLVAALDELVRRPSPIGAMILNQAESTPSKPDGVLENGGVWPSINGTLIWALAMAGGSSAWDEWKKNSLAIHAEAYPEIWYGIWSGPDCYNSVLSKHPGQTMFAEPSKDGRKDPSDWGTNWTDYPVMNMHPHAWPLYSAAKLLGVDFHETGVRFNPALPLAEYEFSSPLLGFSKSQKGFSGWYAPATAGRWTIEIQLTDSEKVGLKQIKVNGTVEPLPHGLQSIRLTGESRREKPLRWEIS
ncbi:MAG: hypothetical protein ABSF16_06150 [Terracidiphilus sp.]|jgi:hypothetical protein